MLGTSSNIEGVEQHKKMLRDIGYHQGTLVMFLSFFVCHFIIFCLLPFLEAVDGLVLLGQGKDVFIWITKVINFVMWWITLLPQSPNIGLLTLTMVQKTLLFTWIITIAQLTFSMQLLELTFLGTRMFSWHPLCKWRANVLLQLTSLSLNCKSNS